MESNDRKITMGVFVRQEDITKEIQELIKLEKGVKARGLHAPIPLDPVLWKEGFAGGYAMITGEN